MEQKQELVQFPGPETPNIQILYAQKFAQFVGEAVAEHITNATLKFIRGNTETAHRAAMEEVYKIWPIIAKFVKEEVSPGDVYDFEQLQQWAEGNGFVTAES